MRKKIAAGNWKMNTSQEEAKMLAKSVAEADRDADVLTILGVPFVYLNQVKDITDAYSHIEVAAQNCHHKSSGAYTGEISAPMLKSMGMKYVIIGHSERREYNHENSELLNSKLQQAFDNDLIPIYCCGEPLDIRKAGTHEEYVIHQLEETIFHLGVEEFKKLIIAYEPIWAIGTGETASAEQAQEMHLAIRNSIAEKYGNDVSDRISILYGGSVKADNAKEIFGMPDVDGGLVGGASLKSSEFITIINSF